MPITLEEAAQFMTARLSDLGFSRRGTELRSEANEGVAVIELVNSRWSRHDIRCNYGICTGLGPKYKFPTTMFGDCIPIAPVHLHDFSLSQFPDADMSCAKPTSRGVHEAEVLQFIDAVVLPCAVRLLALREYNNLIEFMVANKYVRGFPEIAIAVFLECDQFADAKKLCSQIYQNCTDAQRKWVDSMGLSPSN